MLSVIFRWECCRCMRVHVRVHFILFNKIWKIQIIKLTTNKSHIVYFEMRYIFNRVDRFDWFLLKVPVHFMWNDEKPKFKKKKFQLKIWKFFDKFKFENVPAIPVKIHQNDPLLIFKFHKFLQSLFFIANRIYTEFLFSRCFTAPSPHLTCSLYFMIHLWNYCAYGWRFLWSLHFELFFFFLSKQLTALSIGFVIFRPENWSEFFYK